MAHQQGHGDRVAELITLAIEQKPTRRPIVPITAWSPVAWGGRDEAADGLRQALRLWPEYRDAHSNLGLVFQQQGHLALARACLEVVLRLEPVHVDALFNLGNVLSELCYPEEAIPLSPEGALRPTVRR